MLLVPPVTAFTTVTVLATLFAMATSPVASSAAAPMGPEPVATVCVTDCCNSSTIDAVPAPPLLATTARCSRGSTATPIGFEPTTTVWPVLVAILMSATELQPNKVTAAIFCWGSIATPEGSGVGEQPVTSTLCSTVKSTAFVTLPLPFATSSAKRRAEVSRLNGTVAINWRFPLPVQVVGREIPSRRTFRLVVPFVQVSPLPRTITVCGDGLGPLPSVELDTKVVGLVLVMENGFIAPRLRTLTLLSVWLATTAMFVPGSMATAIGPGRVLNKLLSFKRRGAVGSITESVLAKKLTATTMLVSGL